MTRPFRAAVLHVNSARYTSNSPTMRIARFAAEELGVPLIHDPATAQQHQRTRFDVLFVKQGMLKFSEHRAEALTIHAAAKHVIDLQNDYIMVPDKRFKQPDATWGTVPARATQYVNWNMLTWEHGLPLPSGRGIRGLLYYGAWREGRARYFNEYLRAGVPYPVHISSYRGWPKFEAINPTARRVKPFKDQKELREYEMSLYIEDETSHTLYCSAANRFYECLYLGIPMAFDMSCLPTMRTAGYDVWNYVVSTPREVAALLRHSGSVRQAQRAAWYRDYRHELRLQLRATVRKVFGSKAFQLRRL